MSRLFTIAVFLATALPANAQPCRLGLLLAVDVSSSISADEYRLQMDGLAAALIAPTLGTEFLPTMDEGSIVVQPFQIPSVALEEALEKQEAIGFPTIIRPSFTMGGTGGGIAYNREEFEQIVSHGLEMSPTTEVLLEESVIGWKEFEMEVVRDRNEPAPRAPKTVPEAPLPNAASRSTRWIHSAPALCHASAASIGWWNRPPGNYGSRPWPPGAPFRR